MIKKLAVPKRVIASAFLALAFFISFHVDVFAAEEMVDISTVTVTDMPDGAKPVYTRTLYVPDKVGVYAKHTDYWEDSELWITLYKVVGNTKEFVTVWPLDSYGETVNTRFYPPKGPGYYTLEVYCALDERYDYDCSGTATLSSWDVQ